MESKNEEQPLTFKRLQRALITAVNNRILNGEYTERGLARIVGVSQPQIHNVLKGVRKLTPELGDRILIKLNINLLEIVSKDKGDIALCSQPWIASGNDKLRKSSTRQTLEQ